MNLVKTAEDRQIFKLIFARQLMGWPFAAPPGLPPERLAALRKAFGDTMRDREFLTEAEKMGLEVTPVTGVTIENLVAELYRTTGPDVTRRIGAMLK